MEQRGEEGAPAHAREPVRAEQLIVRDAAQGDRQRNGLGRRSTPESSLFKVQVRYGGECQAVRVAQRLF